MPHSQMSAGFSPKRITTATSTVALDGLPNDFSISRYLSLQALSISSLPFIITNDGRPLPDSHLILLALNEECRILRRGGFYHLPLRSDITKGHPCDIVFVDEPWGNKGNKKWDSSNWKQRLDMCDASEFPFQHNLSAQHNIFPSLCSKAQAVGCR